MHDLLTTAAAIALLTACGSVELRRGIPQLVKPTTGSQISDTEAWPDIDRGNQARLAGRHSDAALDLLPLAERGYTEAMVLLAASQAAAGTRASNTAAIHWYRAVLKTHPEVAGALARTLIASGREQGIAEAERLLRGIVSQGDDIQAEVALLRLYRDYPANDPRRNAQALFERASQSADPGLRLTAVEYARERVVDQASSQRLLKSCREQIAIAPACHVDLARHYRLVGNRVALTQQVEAALLALAKLGSDPRPANGLLPAVNTAALAGRLAKVLVAVADDEDLALLSEQMRNTQRAESRLQQGLADQGAQGRVAVLDPVQVVDLNGKLAPFPAGGLNLIPTAPEAEPELANRVLRWMLKRGGDMPLEAAAVAVASPYLLTDIDLEAVLKKAHAEKRPRAALMLGELYFFAQRVPRDPKRAESFFNTAKQHPTTEVTAHYRLGRLYQSGYLGRPDPELALKNLLYAARRQMVAADRQLARMFYDTPGVRTDRLNAYVFARLSDEAGFPVLVRTLRGGQMSSYPLLERLTADLTATELQKAKGLYARERVVHPVVARSFLGLTPLEQPTRAALAPQYQQTSVVETLKVIAISDQRDGASP